MKGTNQTPVGLMGWATGRLLPKLAEFLKQEHNLQTSMKKDVLESLERQLKKMENIQFKMSQEKQDQLVDPHDSHCWAIDAWELSYDIEDSVDSLLLCISDNDNKRSSETVADPDSFMFLQTLLQDIKVRVQNLSAACRRVGRHFEATTSTCIEDAFREEARQLLGIHELTAEVITMMSSSSQKLKMVSIWGAGGMGKTTLARAVYDNVKGEFHCSAFVSLGLQPDMKKALRDILIHLGKVTYSYKDLYILDEGQLINELRRFIKNKRFLIVIDNVRDMISWRTIECALIDSGCGSRIITTSRILDIAEMSGEVLKLRPLSIDRSRELFYATFTLLCGQKGATIFDLWDEQSDDYSILPGILEKCGGVPLAIITIASLLAAKPRKQWAKVFNSIGFGDEDNSIKLIQFSYYDLPSHLKTCLLYLSIFSKDNVIEKDTLVWRWVAEGFVHGELGESSSSSSSSSLYKLGERYLHELSRRSMIQVVENEDTNNYTCRVHDMVLDLVCTLAKEENIVIILDRDDDDGHHISYQSNAHAVAVHDRVLEKHGLTRMCKPEVRSLNVTRCGISNMMLVLSSFKVLRVLYLEGCRLTADDHRSYGQKNHAGVRHLRYLGIRGVMNTGDLPPMKIGDLRFLQTLDLAGNIEALPPSVTQLRQLKCLRCVSSSTELKLPEGMGNLTSLEELRLGKVYKSPPNLAKELSKLTELRTLRIHTSLTWNTIGDDESEAREEPESLLESLSKLQKMEELELLCDNWTNPCGYVIGPSAFPKVRYMRTNTWLMYQPGALPCLKSVELQVDVHANFDFHKLRYFRLLEKARVKILCWGAKTEDIEKVEAALRSVAHGHPNRPVLILHRSGWSADDKILFLGGLPQAMPLELLRRITNDFSDKQRLGIGTFGTVYKGDLDGDEVAVKLLHSMSARLNYEEDFMKEFENLRRLNHPNIVQLLGYCYETKRIAVEHKGKYVLADESYRALCFDYMHNGSLQGYLHDESHGVDWQIRYKIIKGVCEGLNYLHKGLENPMLHLDLKPGNILLDKNMVPKLADFGLSKLVCDNQTQATSSLLGTIRYCPPEHIERHVFSSKFDIFSLGVVMIEIIAGSKGYDKTAEMPSQEFIDHVQENWRKRIHQATPGCTLPNCECHQVKRCIEIALECVHPKRMQRPDIEDIISRLNETEGDIEKSATLILP